MPYLHIGTGVTVEYHGSLTGYHGHQMTIVNRYITPSALMRYDLADHTGRTILTSVALGSVTPTRTAPSSMWTDRITTIRETAERHGQPTAASVTAHLDPLTQHIREHRYYEAKRALLDLETLLGLADPQTYTATLTELTAFYHARQHGVPLPVSA